MPPRVSRSASHWPRRPKQASPPASQFAIYAGDQPKQNETGQDMAPVEKLAQIQKRLDFVREKMERAIANHELEKARFYSDEERKERENLRLLREQFTGRITAANPARVH